jgi:four helix bundle protein
MPKVSHFRDLRVWQRAIDLVAAVYRISGKFPKGEVFGLTGQMRRAAVSVPSNIAEGHTRASTKEYLNHISIAQGSLAEVETQLEIAARLGYVIRGTAGV